MIVHSNKLYFAGYFFYLSHFVYDFKLYDILNLVR